MAASLFGVPGASQYTAELGAAGIMMVVGMAMTRSNLTTFDGIDILTSLDKAILAGGYSNTHGGLGQ